MQAPVQVAWLLVVLTAATGLYCLARCRLADQSSREERHLDATAALKGMAMAVMALPLVGHEVPEAVWLLVLIPAGLWSLVRSLRARGHRRHHLEHAVGHLGMAYMAVAMASPMAAMTPMADMTAGAGLPWLTEALLAFFVADAVFNGTRLLAVNAFAAPSAGCTSSDSVIWGPRMPDACHLALALGMAVMLIAM